jgi:phosphomevalonate kinase
VSSLRHAGGPGTTGLVVHAPGKAFVSGEYAVLHGAPAVVAAVARFARARLRRGPTPVLSPFLAALRERWPAPAGTFVEVDSRDLEGPDGNKLGLGASAAATVAAAALVRAALGFDPSDPAERSRILDVCIEAHRAAQDGRGSGADVAAAVYGGLVRFQLGGAGEARVTTAALPPAHCLLFFRLGGPAVTPDLLEQVERLGARDRVRHGQLMEEIGTHARRFGGDPIPSMRGQLRALALLGEAAGVAIVPPACHALARTAEALGGAAKPSGAGGGDLAVALVPAARAAELLADSPLVPLPLVLTPVGVSLDDTEGAGDLPCP